MSLAARAGEAHRWVERRHNSDTLHTGKAVQPLNDETKRLQVHVNRGRPELRWRGARQAAITACIGCTIFVFLELTLPGLVTFGRNGLLSFTGLGLIIQLMFLAIVVAILFSIVPSSISGFVLGWLLEYQSEHGHPSPQKAILLGALLGALASIISLAVGLPFVLCIFSHGVCQQDMWSYIEQVLHANSWLYVERITLVLLLASLGGAWTGRQIHGLNRS